MKKRIRLLGVAMVLLGYLGMAQNKNQVTCQVYLVSGDTLQGYAEMDTNAISKKVVFFDKAGQKQKIKAAQTLGVRLDSVVFVTYTARNKKPRLMQKFVKGGKASLFADTFWVSRGIPGEGVSLLGVADYYLVKDEVPYYLDKTKLKAYPERYFGGVPNMLAEIKGTPKKEMEEHYLDWVKRYNMAMASHQ